MASLDHDSIVERVSAVLEQEGDVVAAYLFGSFGSGEATPRSDVDVAVLFQKRQKLERILDLETKVESALGRDADLLDLRAASPFLALDVLRGSRFYCTDEIVADEYELYVLRRAGDLAPLERERRAQLLGLDGHR